VVGKRFGVAWKTGSSSGDRYTMARLGRGSTMVTARYGVGGGRFRVRGASGRRWDPQGGGGQAGGCRRCAVHTAGWTADVQVNGSGRAPLRSSSSRCRLGRSGQRSMRGTWWPGTHGSLGSMVSSKDNSGGSTSSAIGVGGLLRRAWSRGEEIRRQQERA
jgi:hypothetical protein